MTTRHTTEGGLITAVALVAAAAGMAGAARLAGINHDDRHTAKRRLVLHKGPKLTKRPIAVSRSLPTANRCALSDMRQIFQRDPSGTAFGLGNKALADDVVRGGLE